MATPSFARIPILPANLMLSNQAKPNRPVPRKRESEKMAVQEDRATAAEQIRVNQPFRSLLEDPKSGSCTIFLSFRALMTSSAMIWI